MQRGNTPKNPPTMEEIHKHMELTSLRHFHYGHVKLSHLYPHVILDTNVKLSGEANTIIEPEQYIKDQQVPTAPDASSKEPVPSTVNNRCASGHAYIYGGAKQSGYICHICDKKRTHEYSH